MRWYGGTDRWLALTVPEVFPVDNLRLQAESKSNYYMLRCTILLDLLPLHPLLILLCLLLGIAEVVVLLLLVSPSPVGASG